MRVREAQCAYCELVIEPGQTAVVSPDNDRELMHRACAKELGMMMVGDAPAYGGVTDEEVISRDYASSPEAVTARIEARKGGTR